MKAGYLLLFFVPIFFACQNTSKPAPVEMSFDRDLWLTKEGQDYPFRAQMLKDVVYNDTIRMLKKKEILSLLGDPDREQDNHFYYTISQKRIDLWPIHTATMVIKFIDEETIEWIKIHG